MFCQRIWEYFTFPFIGPEIERARICFSHQIMNILSSVRVDWKRASMDDWLISANVTFLKWSFMKPNFVLFLLNIIKMKVKLFNNFLIFLLPLEKILYQKIPMHAQ